MPSRPLELDLNELLVYPHPNEQRYPTSALANAKYGLCEQVEAQMNDSEMASFDLIQLIKNQYQSALITDRALDQKNEKVIVKVLWFNNREYEEWIEESSNRIRKVDVQRPNHTLHPIFQYPYESLVVIQQTIYDYLMSIPQERNIIDHHDKLATQIKSVQVERCSQLLSFLMDHTCLPMDLIKMVVNYY